MLRRRIGPALRGVRGLAQAHPQRRGEEPGTQRGRPVAGFASSPSPHPGRAGSDLRPRPVPPARPPMAAPPEDGGPKALAIGNRCLTGSRDLRLQRAGRSGFPKAAALRLPTEPIRPAPAGGGGGRNLLTGVVGGLERDREAGFPGKQNLWVAGMHDSLRRFPDSGRALRLLPAP